MNRIKGQASLEFLMTYGWAILVIGVVMVALWQWGVFNPQGNVRPSFLGFWGVVPMDFQYKTNGDLVFSFQNSVIDGDINITAINITISDKDKYSTGQLASPINISSGQVTTWPLSHLVSILPSGKAGQSYNLHVTIEYVDDRLGADRKFRSSGTISGTIESV
jgi:hypothetical protein